MAARTRIRRKIRRTAPPVRRAQAAAPARSTRRGLSDLMIGGVMDPAEKAADRMADRALGGQAPAPLVSQHGVVHRTCAGCAAEDEGGALKRSAHGAPVVAPGAAAAPAPQSVARAVDALGAGRRMSRAERAFFEPRFGRDFSDVRLHEGPAAARATRALGARAFARGTDVALGPDGQDRQTLAHELAHVVQQDGTTRRAPIRRSTCATCPSPVNPEVEATIQPILSFGTPSGSQWGSTNWTGAKGLGVSIWHRERNTCVKTPVAGTQTDIWEVCPRKIKLHASVPMVIDRTEIRRTSGGKRWWMECGAPAGPMMFDTKAAAKAAFGTPKPITVAGVIHHEKYHVGVSKRAVEAAIRARADLTQQIAPYSQTEIAKWKSGLETTLNAAQDTQLKANPSEANEERNAATAECTRY